MPFPPRLAGRAAVLTRRRLRRAGALLVAAALLSPLVACSNRQSSANRQPHTGSASASTVNGAQVITLTARNFRFSPSTITVHPGRVLVVLVNKDEGAPHNFSLVGFPADFVPLVSGGKTAQASFTAPSPGRYTFVCTIHAKQGQTGTLVVLPS